MREPKIVFHHIPKCGGTSIVKGLALAYYPWRLLQFRKRGFCANLNSRAATLVAEHYAVDRYAFRRQLLRYNIERSDFPFIAGHYPFDHKSYENHWHEWSFITLLRDPVERWYSEYFWNRYKSHDYHKTSLSMEEYAFSDQGIVNAQSFVNYLSLSKMMNMEPMQIHIEESLDTIKKMAVVGFLDNLEGFRGQMKDRFGYKPYFFELNRSPASEEQRKLPDSHSDLHKRILALTQADQEIYRKAREISLI